MKLFSFELSHLHSSKLSFSIILPQNELIGNFATEPDERLLLIYAFMDETAIFSTDESFYRKVIQWESDNNLNSYLSDRVFDVLTKLSNKGILKEEYYNYLDEYSARYILQAHDYKRLKKFLLEKQDRISTVIEKYKMPVMVDPFADNNLDESELPF
ncbi:hypothetical protein [Enterococcus casseliflavus]|uniref:hypothetical protein n=1 Tax=Enterococcus casseliflavus TaxID=37734 RepID=UPI0039A7336E